VSREFAIFQKLKEGWLIPVCR